MEHNLHRRRRLFLIVAALFAVAALAYSAAAKKLPPERLIDLNVANVKELAELPGIGPTTAQAIIQFRQKSGPFHRVEDLLVIRGISEAKLKKLRPYVVIPPPPRPPAAAPARKPAPSATRPANTPGTANKPAPAAPTRTPATAATGTPSAPAKKAN